jgi:tetratricopeptide (TPR) repeat protein
MLREMGGRLNNLALIAMESGEHEHALTYVLEARPITESVGDPNAHFLTLLNLFRAYIFTQDHQRAQQVLTEAHEIAGRVTDKSALANLYVHTAEFRLLYSETEQAIVSAERALAAARSTPDRAVMARAHLIRGICEHYAGRPEPALALVRQGFNILREGEMRRHWAYFIGATSQIYIALGRYEAGVKLMAAGTLRMNSLVQKIWSMYSSQYKLFIGKAKEVLGEEGYARALAEGAELSIEAATALAMED